MFLQEEDGFHKAIGVEIMKDGVRSRINGVRRDIVLSAGNAALASLSASSHIAFSGSFQTPQVLELSGIGDPEILSRNGISCAIDLPGVGENLRPSIQ